MTWLNDIFTQASNVEIKTDVGSDLDATLAKYGPKLVLWIFLAILLAKIIGHFLLKKIG
jgi:hypothetical protein